MNSLLPSGTVTFLFTDIEGSTGLWERQPDAMRAALARHDEILQSAVREHHGQIVKQTGDGLHAVFEAAEDALQAALASQISLISEIWPGIEALPVRMALHTGEAELRAGDYYGRAVNRVARLMSAAAGGQILTSLATAEIVCDRLPEGVSFIALGAVQLKDIPRPVQLFQIHHPDLPERPSPQTQSPSTPNNLPAQISSFIGRAEEIAEIKGLLFGGDVEGLQKENATRMLSLIGPGGTGKTRLSLQAASEMLHRFPDGVWLVELAPLSKPAQILPAVSAPLGLEEGPGRPLETRLLEAIGEHQILLILDNCEHLIDECARLADVLLRSCDHLRILASSREALGIAGERPIRTRSMDLPPSNGNLSVEDLAKYDAIQLFIERAQAANPGLTFSSANADSIHQICVRLDGIPLAIELAAARCRVLSPQQILARLDDRFQLLTGGSRTALPRQRTLQALIDWSYDLLDEGEKVVLRRISVFLDGCTLEAAETVTGVEPVQSVEVLDILDQLVSKSLVVANENDWGMRYRMLETIRQYAQAKLAEGGEARLMRDRHLAYFLAQSELGHQALTELRGLLHLDRLVPEAENLRLAQAWALDHDIPSALAFAGKITARWSLILPAAELFGFLKNVLARIEDHPDYSGPDADLEKRRRLGAALTSAGNLAFGLGFNKLALEYVTRGLELARETADLTTVSWALGIGGSAAGAVGQREQSVAWFKELSAMIDQIANRWVQAMHLVSGTPYIEEVLEGNLANTLAAWERGMAMFREGGDSWGLAWGNLMAARMYQFQKLFNDARQMAAQALVQFEALNDRVFTTNARSLLAEITRREGDLEEAVGQYRRLLSEWRDAGNQGALARCLECLAFMACAHIGEAEGEQSQITRRYAVMLLGAAAVIRQTHDAPMTSLEEPEYEREFTALQQALGEDRFKTAWRQGQNLTVEEAVEIAKTGPNPAALQSDFTGP